MIDMHVWLKAPRFKGGQHVMCHCPSFVFLSLDCDYLIRIAAVGHTTPPNDRKKVKKESLTYTSIQLNYVKTRRTMFVCLFFFCFNLSNTGILMCHDKILTKRISINRRLFELEGIRFIQCFFFLNR